ncbi:alpha/beta hydrolase [Rhodococcus tukisamuensis]|uniref:Enterochelin esterase n=1 Tax=Rhodococcus tukisamuensis TaxID=168276 RepID=A0A1G6UV51_9NOCA|nr:alpha/beta hydrolase-fold protein [Rhodococcus tukisamuensis]SDD45218.1 Enterochelin esterase [Rhodococcus tukisamuensis]
MDWLWRTSLISGPVPWILAALGVVGGLWLLFAPTADTRRYRRLAVPITATVALALTLVGWVVVERWWRPFPDPIATEIYVWIGFGAWALLLAGVRVATDRRLRRSAVAVLAAVAVVAVSAAQVNLVFDAYPTVRDALGLPDPNRIALADVPPPTPDPVTGTPLASVWQPPADLPSSGRVVTAPIPGTVSGFGARDAVVYLPPAYFTDPRPVLPVLVLLAGQPGSPQDWLAGGKLVQTMNTFAAAHGGLAPVVVVADATGSQFGNPLCMDSSLGNVATYLAQDVPDWVTSHLQVNADPRAWAIGGLSYGGTCALQMATNHPQRYPTFLDLSGQEEPTLGDRNRTLAAAFGGDAAKFAAVNPLDLLAAHPYPDSAGVFVVGGDDRDFKPGQRKVYEAARKAGMDVRYVEVPGGHSFAVWSAGLEGQLGWLAQRLGLTS